ASAGDEAAMSVPRASPSDGFLASVLQRGMSQWSVDEYAAIAQGFTYLGNSLCAATRLEPDNVPGLRNVLGLAQSAASLGLEYLANGEPETGVEILAAEHPQLIFRAGLTLVGMLGD